MFITARHLLLHFVVLNQLLCTQIFLFPLVILPGQPNYICWRTAFINHTKLLVAGWESSIDYHFLILNAWSLHQKNHFPWVSRDERQSRDDELLLGRARGSFQCKNKQNTRTNEVSFSNGGVICDLQSYLHEILILSVLIMLSLLIQLRLLLLLLPELLLLLQLPFTATIVTITPTNTVALSFITL